MSAVSFAQDPWINEIHYDNSGTDVNECIEIAGTAGTDVSGWTLVLYNGSGGGTYGTINLSGTIPDEGCGFGALSFCFTGIQNGPDGIALVDNTSTVQQFLSYEGSFTATNGPANGQTSTNIGVSEGSGTGATQSMQLTGSGGAYGDFSWSSGINASQGSLNASQNIVPCGLGGNTITTGAVTGGPFNVDCTTGDNGTIAFTSTGTFNAGNVFTVQLSDAAGSFASPTDIGTLSGASAEGVDPSSTISFTIPPGTSTGASYEIRIISSNPSATSGNTQTISITLTGSCTPPHITSVIINSCNPTCSEGYNELIFGTTGDYSVNMTSSDFSVMYGSVAPPGTNNTLTDNLNTNVATTTALNTAAGCPGNLVDGTGLTLPPGSSWILAHDGICIDALDWSGLCGQGPIYIIYTTDATWNVSGTFKNGNTGGDRYFNTSITTTSGATFDIDYTYNSTLLQSGAAGDGDYVSFGPGGGSPEAYGDNDCMLEPILLPIEMIGFNGEFIQDHVLLQWTTITEINSSHFEVYRSQDGISYEMVGTLGAAGNSTNQLDYRLIDDNPYSGMSYYHLIGEDLDGTRTNHGTIAVHSAINHVFYDYVNEELVFENSANAIVIASDGRQVASCSDCNKIPLSAQGIFFVYDVITGYSQKVLIR